MKSCPHCRSNLKFWRVKNYRAPTKKWYQYSTEPFYQKQCYVCDELIVRRHNEYWYYRVAFPLCIIPLIFSNITTGEQSIFLKGLTISIGLLGIYLAHKQSFDFEYITPEEQKKNKLKSYIDYAGSYIDNPIEINEYCEKYSLNAKDIYNQISLGLIEAYAFEGVDFINDIEPNNET